MNNTTTDHLSLFEIKENTQIFLRQSCILGQNNGKSFKFCRFSKYNVHITVLSHPGGHWSVKNHVIVDDCDSNSHISLSSHYGYGMVFFGFKSTGKGAVILKD